MLPTLRNTVTSFLCVLMLFGCTESTPPASTFESSLEAASPAVSENTPLPAGEAVEGQDKHTDILVARVTQKLTGDLDEIRKRRAMRALVSYSRTNFFLDGSQMHGASYELLREYEKQLNAGTKNPAKKLVVVFVPVPFEDLLPWLAEGRGDIAVAGLTITPERQDLVDFSVPIAKNVREVVVTHKSIEGIASPDDLSGQEVYVRPGSSYVTHLEALNNRFVDEGRSGVKVLEGDPDLTTEDILQLINAGVLDMTVADEHIARAWAQVLPDMVIHDVSVHEGGSIGWAIRKKSPQLKESIDKFVAANRKGTLLGNILFKRYFESTEWISNPTGSEGKSRLDQMADLFQKYGSQYSFDWLALAAQGYQESALDHSKRSPVGAVGVMQLLPSTAADKNVGIRDISKLDNNVHAGAKYLDFLRARYFNDPSIPAEDQVDFALAAYNAGPARVAQLRTKAEGRGLDPNRWFGHVEHVAAEVIGRETVEYVANINKYYVAYKLMLEREVNRREQLRQFSDASHY